MAKNAAITRYLDKGDGFVSKANNSHWRQTICNINLNLNINGFNATKYNCAYLRECYLSLDRLRTRYRHYGQGISEIANIQNISIFNI